MLLCGTACIANGRFWISRKGNEGFTQRRKREELIISLRLRGRQALRLCVKPTIIKDDLIFHFASTTPVKLMGCLLVEVTCRVP